MLAVSVEAGLTAKVCVGVDCLLGWADRSRRHTGVPTEVGVRADSSFGLTMSRR